jgi:hypothetical protein
MHVCGVGGTERGGEGVMYVHFKYIFMFLIDCICKYVNVGTKNGSHRSHQVGTTKWQNLESEEDPCAERMEIK